jgi:hypothetical protein
MEFTIKGQRKEKLTVGKFDPPAAFNLEDIQNFPEERLQPILNLPVTFEEGRDFSALMDFHEEELVHPWLAKLPQAPFLEMQSPSIEKPREWTFSIIDQAGATVAHQDGKGTPPAKLSWGGDDSQRGFIAVDTVYIPQLAVVDKEGYHHTYMGQPIVFPGLSYKSQGKTTIELSSKRLFQEKKTDFSKEARFLLQRVCDMIREGSHLPFAIQPYADDDALARGRQQVLAKYFAGTLVIPENQIIASAPLGSEKRGEAMAIIFNAVPGGSGL